MTLTGQHTIAATPKIIWDMMMNPDILARITPGITALERIDDDNYKAIAQVKIGPVGGAFTGTLKVADRNEPHTFTLLVQQNSKIGNANATVAMRLEETAPGQTDVSFVGDVKLAGMLASMGQRVLTPVANMLSGQFFKALQKELDDMV